MKNIKWYYVAIPVALIVLWWAMSSSKRTVMGRPYSSPPSTGWGGILTGGGSLLTGASDLLDSVLGRSDNNSDETAG